MAENSHTYLKSAPRINSGVCMIIVWMNGMVRAHEFRRYSRSSTTQLPSCCLNSECFLFSRARCSRRDLWVMSSHFRYENRKTETWWLTGNPKGLERWYTRNNNIKKKSERTFYCVYQSLLFFFRLSQNKAISCTEKDILNDRGSPWIKI